MLLTRSLSGWHKDVATHLLMPTPRWVSKGPRSFQLRGPFALPGLRHDIQLLANEGCLKGLVDGFLTRLEAATLDGFVDRSANRLGNPHVHFPVSPFSTGFPEALNTFDSLYVRHGTSSTALKTVTRNARF
jgi:hypothetical protein